MKKSMLTRIIVGLVLSAIFIMLWLFGKPGTTGEIIYMCIFSIIGLLCVHEMTDVLKAANYKPAAFPLLAFAVVFPFLLYYNPGFMLIAAYVAILITILARIFNPHGRNEDMIMGLFIYLYPILPLLCLFMVCTLDKISSISRLAMFVTFACPLLGDTLAYFFGVSFGKHKLCEHISPKKTIAGSVGGVIGGGLGGLGAYYMQYLIQYIFSTELDFVEMPILILLGLSLGLLGQVGDLFASCIKRWAGVKDYGKLFPGHGGMLDRIDSVIMCAPLVLCVFEGIIKS